jgi:hypothetical protein
MLFRKAVRAGTDAALGEENISHGLSSYAADKKENPQTC